MNTIQRISVIFGTLGLALWLGGCMSSAIVPLRPVQRVEVEEPAATRPTTSAATAPATEPVAATATAPATMAATRPAKHYQIIDPNQTERFLYLGNYDRIWQQSMELLTHLGYRLDRQDYRLGVLTTLPLASGQCVEPWRRDATTFNAALENTINQQRRSVRVTIKPAPGKPDFYAIAVQVLVERYTNPAEGIGTIAFAEGSGFGRTGLALQSDYLEPGAPEAARWYIAGHDVGLETKILDKLFEHI